MRPRASQPGTISCPRGAQFLFYFLMATVAPIPAHRGRRPAHWLDSGQHGPRRPPRRGTVTIMIGSSIAQDVGVTHRKRRRRPTSEPSDRRFGSTLDGRGPRQGMQRSWVGQLNPSYGSATSSAAYCTPSCMSQHAARVRPAERPLKKANLHTPIAVVHARQPTNMR